MIVNHSPMLAGCAALIALVCASGATAQEAVDANSVRGNQVTTSSVQYDVPNLMLVRQDGQSVSLRKEMDDGRPVVLNFIFTTCGSICPLMSQVLGVFQRKLGAESAHVHLMSISIDPEQDTPGAPARLCGSLWSRSRLAVLHRNTRGEPERPTGVQCVPRRQDEPYAGNLASRGPRAAVDAAGRLRDARSTAAPLPSTASGKMIRSGTAAPLRAIAALVLSALVGASALCADSEGEGIYRRGMSTSGVALRGERQPGLYVEGATAACVNCHRRSGLGMKEGHLTIPPVAGKYLFHPRAGNVDDLDLMFVPGMHADRDPYTDATLSKAIREGVGADGKPLDVLMPRFQLDDPQMACTDQLPEGTFGGSVPGATESTLHFATVLTPDSDPAVRQGVLDVLNKFFDDKNHYTRAESPRLRSSKRMMFKVNRHWQLHVWQLSGAPETWEAQLRTQLAAQPVFAVISGLGGRNWAPVHHFCESEELPCLFPNVDLPVDDVHAFDTLYFSKGVLLEAELIAHGLRAGNDHSHKHRIIQLYRRSDVGVEAAAALRKALGPDEAAYIDAGLPDTATRKELRAAVAKAGPGDVLVLWLRSQDVAELGAVPHGVRAVYMSGRMGGLDLAPLPASWRGITHMAYPFELPERRAVQVDYPMGWFRMRQIPVVAAQVQADTYLACIILSDTINHMVDTFVRDYLVERVDDGLEHRVLTGYYPRLTLTPGQSFASKGGYLVHFSEGPRSRVVADGEWVVP